MERLRLSHSTGRCAHTHSHVHVRRRESYPVSPHPATQGGTVTARRCWIGQHVPPGFCCSARDRSGHPGAREVVRGAAARRDGAVDLDGLREPPRAAGDLEAAVEALVPCVGARACQVRLWRPLGRVGPSRRLCPGGIRAHAERDLAPQGPRGRPDAAAECGRREGGLAAPHARTAHNPALDQRAVVGAHLPAGGDPHPLGGWRARRDAGVAAQAAPAPGRYKGQLHPRRPAGLPPERDRIIDRHGAPNLPLHRQASGGLHPM
eukprot:scaffold6441_cov123-Isochrysis_galbana.AAC.1